MLFQLAENLGMTVARLKDELTYSELEKWLLFYQSKQKQEHGGSNVDDWESSPESVAKALNL